MRDGSRKPDSPGIRTNQVNGSTEDTCTPFHICGAGVYVPDVTMTSEPTASVAAPSHSKTSSQACGLRQASTRPVSASSVAVAPNVLVFSACAMVRPNVVTRGDGRNMSG